MSDEKKKDLCPVCTAAIKKAGLTEEHDRKDLSAYLCPICAAAEEQEK